MRGGALSHPEVIELLKPFIVTMWNGRSNEEMPPALKKVYNEASLPQHGNILLFILDNQSNVMGVFPPFPKNNPGALGFDANRMGQYLKQKIIKYSASLDLPTLEKNSTQLHLPEIKGDSTPAGVRILLTSKNLRIASYRAPVAEMVEITASEREALAFPKKQTVLDANIIKRWLAQIYPPAIMDRTGQVSSLQGKLSFQPVQENIAILQGTVKIQLDDAQQTVYQGKVGFVFYYEKNSKKWLSLQGFFEGVYPKWDSHRNDTMPIHMEAIFESTPEEKT